MWAMMPMLRTLARSTAVSVANVSPSSRRACVCGSAGRAPGRGASPRAGLLPAVVGEGLVGLRHLVHVLAALHARAEAVGGVEDLVHEALGHRLLAALPGEADEPAQGQG